MAETLETQEQFSVVVRRIFKRDQVLTCVAHAQSVRAVERSVIANISTFADSMGGCPEKKGIRIGSKFLAVQGRGGRWLSKGEEDEFVGCPGKKKNGARWLDAQAEGGCSPSSPEHEAFCARLRCHSWTRGFIRRGMAGTRLSVRCIRASAPCRATCLVYSSTRSPRRLRCGRSI
jgi:hypothetical protein